MIKIPSKVNERGMITIPIVIREQLGIDATTELLFDVNRKGQIIISKKEAPDEFKEISGTSTQDDE